MYPVAANENREGSDLMATDARISTALPSHPKTKKLARRLGPAGPLGCIYLFLWVASNRSDGDLTGMTDEDIELAVDWTGDDGAFVRAMVDVGFLEGIASERLVHDWAEHNPWAAGAGARSEKSRWAALCKQHGRAEAARQMPEYAQRIGAASHPQAGSEPESASGKPDAVLESASGTQLAESGSAPSPFRLPSDSFPSPPPTAKKPAKARAAPIPAPDDVDAQVWADWLKLRKDKGATVTTTVIDGARCEALKAGMAFEAFLREWCIRGSQGLKADWLKPDNRAGPATRPASESFRERDDRIARERVKAWAPGVAAGAERDQHIIEMEPANVFALQGD